MFFFVWIILLFGCAKSEKEVCLDKKLSLRQVMFLGNDLLCFCLNEDNVDNNILILKDKKGNVIEEVMNFRSDPVPYFEVQNQSVSLVYDYPISRDSLNVEAEIRNHVTQTYSLGKTVIEIVALRRWQGSQIVSSVQMDSIAINKKNGTIFIFHNNNSIEVSLNNIRIIRHKTYIESFEQGIYKYAEIVATNGRNVENALVEMIFE